MDTPVLIPNTEVKHISGDNIWTGSSGDSDVDTPVLIPNTEVKHISGDNIWTGSSEDSTLPGNLTHLWMGLFLFGISLLL